jgi:uncharacterized protein YqgC (DUF456 family)
MRLRQSKFRREIRTFSKLKIFLAIPLILIGIWGMILPVIPGAVFFISGIILIFPSFENKIKSRSKK